MSAEAKPVLAAGPGTTGLWRCELPRETLLWSGAVYDLFGMPQATPLKRPRILERYGDGSRERLEVLRGFALQSGRSFSLEAAIWAGSGTRRWIRIDGKLFASGLAPRRLIGTKRDVSEERAAWRAARSLPGHDALTGLPGRGPFAEALLARGEAGEMATAMAIRLENLGEINRQAGFAAGDACLVETAARLRYGLDGLGRAFRLHRATFAATLADAPEPEKLSAVIRRLLAPLFDPVPWQGAVLFPIARIRPWRRAGGDLL